jgi:hypothetical protein
MRSATGLSNKAGVCRKFVALWLQAEVTSDRAFNFVITGYSMIDWIKNDPSVPPSAKAASPLLYNDPWMKICGDLANGSKHFKLKRRIPIVSAATSTQGFGLGRFGKGKFGLGEESISVELDDGTTFGILELVQGVLSAWETFFSSHGI